MLSKLESKVLMKGLLALCWFCPLTLAWTISNGFPGAPINSNGAIRVAFSSGSPKTVNLALTLQNSDNTLSAVTTYYNIEVPSFGNSFVSISSIKPAINYWMVAVDTQNSENYATFGPFTVADPFSDPPSTSASGSGTTYQTNGVQPTASTTSTSSKSTSTSDRNVNSGIEDTVHTIGLAAIIGISVGGTIFLAAVVGILVYFCCLRQSLATPKISEIKPSNNTRIPMTMASKISSTPINNHSAVSESNVSSPSCIPASASNSSQNGGMLTPPPAYPASPDATSFSVTFNNEQQYHSEPQAACQQEHTASNSFMPFPFKTYQPAEPYYINANINKNPYYIQQQQMNSSQSTDPMLIANYPLSNTSGVYHSGPDSQRYEYPNSSFVAKTSDEANQHEKIHVESQQQYQIPNENPLAEASNTSYCQKPDDVSVAVSNAIYYQKPDDVSAGPLGTLEHKPHERA